MGKKHEISHREAVAALKAILQGQVITVGQSIVLKHGGQTLQVRRVAQRMTGAQA